VSAIVVFVLFYFFLLYSLKKGGENDRKEKIGVNSLARLCGRKRSVFIIVQRIEEYEEDKTALDMQLVDSTRRGASGKWRANHMERIV